MPTFDEYMIQMSWDGTNWERASTFEEIANCATFGHAVKVLDEVSQYWQTVEPEDDEEGVCVPIAFRIKQVAWEGVA